MMIFFSSGTCLAASNPTTSANPCSLCLHRFDHCKATFIYIIIIYKKYSVIINKGMMKMLKIIISIIIQFPFITNAMLQCQVSLCTAGILLSHFASLPSNKKNLITRFQITLKNDPCFQIASFPLTPFNSQSVELKNCKRENQTSLLENAVATAKFRY